MIELELICIVLDFYFNFFKFIMNENIIEKKFIWVDNPTSRMGLVGSEEEGFNNMDLFGFGLSKKRFYCDITLKQLN